VKLKEWDQRYASGEAAFDQAVPLVVEIAPRLTPGRALDVACGAGRNAIYLAQLGWRVNAIDGSAAALETLRSRAGTLPIETELVDLQRDPLAIETSAYELIVVSYYLQRDLFPALKRGLCECGVLIAIVHTGEPATPRRAAAGELRSWFEGWEILHYYEGGPRENCHKQPVAEIAARKT
jgi:tellurite methyltransferase